jgi:hypothetical protein
MKRIIRPATVGILAYRVHQDLPFTEEGMIRPLNSRLANHTDVVCAW